MLKNSTLFILKSVLTICLFNTCIILYAQNYSAGSIVLNNSDSLVGLIRVLTEDDFSYIIYKKDSSSIDTSIYAEDVKNIYYDNGKMYETFTISVKDKKITDFFRCVVKGKVSLYIWLDNENIEHLYIKKEDSTIQELIEKKEIVDLQERTYALYYRVLGEAFFKCPKLLDPNNRIKLNEAGIKNSIINYHKCINESYSKYDLIESSNGSVSKKSKIKIYQVGFYVGKVLTSNEHAENNLYRGGYNLGFLLNIFPFKNNENKSIQFEIVSISHKYETASTSYKTYENTAFRTVFKYYIDFNNSALYSGIGIQLFYFSRNQISSGRSILFPHIGYIYNFGKFKLFADIRYMVIANNSLSANIGIIINSKENKIKH